MTVFQHARRGLALLALATVAALPVQAATQAQLDALHAALGTDQLLDILAEEGRADGAGLREEMFPDRTGAGWDGMLRQIYAMPAITREFRTEFDREMRDTDVTALLDFFQSDAGQRVARFEVAGRRAISAEDVEAAARQTYNAHLQSPDARLELLGAFIDMNDLVENNVAGAMTSSFAFLRGLAQGGGFEMSEDEMVAQVWDSEDELRSDTTEWVGAYLTLAYDPLSDAELKDYIQLSETRPGRDLNRALFAGFYTVFTRISFDLGKAASSFMVTEEL